MSYPDQALAEEIGERVERFVREIVAAYERDPRLEDHGPSEDLVRELRAKAREAGVMTPHILPDHTHLSQRGTAHVLKKSGLSPLGPVACNTGAPDEGNMFLLGKVATDAQRARFLDKLLTGEARSAFFMTEPSAENGAGSDPSMMKTVCVQDGDEWVINGHKTYITGAEGASVGIVMAKAEEGACMFLVDLPHPAIRIVRLLDTIDSSMPGGHAEIRIENLRVPASDMLGNPGKGSGTRRSALRRRACLTVCAGMGLRPGRTRSPPAMPAAARRSASCWWIMRASVSCWQRTRST